MTLERIRKLAFRWFLIFAVVIPLYFWMGSLGGAIGAVFGLTIGLSLWLIGICAVLFAMSFVFPPAGVLLVVPIALFGVIGGLAESIIWESTTDWLLAKN